MGAVQRLRAGRIRLGAILRRLSLPKLLNHLNRRLGAFCSGTKAQIMGVAPWLGWVVQRTRSSWGSARRARALSGSCAVDFGRNSLVESSLSVPLCHFPRKYLVQSFSGLAGAPAGGKAAGRHQIHLSPGSRAFGGTAASSRCKRHIAAWRLDRRTGCPARSSSGFASVHCPVFRSEGASGITLGVNGMGA